MESVLERRESFEARHPDIEIETPLATRSGLWEVHFPGNGGTAGFDSAELMMLALESRFGVPG